MDELIKELYDLSKKAFNNDEIPVSALIVKNGKIIGKGINTRHNSKSVLGHAEINAIVDACNFAGDWRLDDCEIYVTLLPCMMCTGAIIDSRIKKVYYLCDRTNVCFNSCEYINAVKLYNKKYEDKCLKLLQLFFENKRK